MTYQKDDGAVTECMVRAVKTDDGARLSVTLPGGKVAQLTASEALDLARQCFVLGVRLSGETPQGRLRASLATKLLLRQAEQELRER